jgi:riboflavin kinase/FMN adenylyltransferase
LNTLGWQEFIGSRSTLPWSVTIGAFDGVHLGHQKLIGAVRSREPLARSAVITFRENPKRILRPQTHWAAISSLGQRLEAIEACGVQSCVLIDFSENFGTLSGASFLSSLEAAGVGFIFVGPNFRCGHRMDTDAQKLVSLAASLGMEAEIVDSLFHGGHPISSSRIRNAILEGRLSEASAMLGRPYVLELGRAWKVEGAFWKVEMGEGTLLPPEGSYRVAFEGGQSEDSPTATVRGSTVVVDGDPRGSARLAFLESVSREEKKEI